MMNMLHQAVVDPSMASGGVYVSEGLAPVPQKVTERIWRWEYIEMGSCFQNSGEQHERGSPAQHRGKLGHLLGCNVFHRT